VIGEEINQAELLAYFKVNPTSKNIGRDLERASRNHGEIWVKSLSKGFWKRQD